jgi:hypothetical protein
MIETHLRSHGIRFMRDDEGDFRVELGVDGCDAPIIMWLCANGEERTTYQVTSALPDFRPCALREQAVELCNSWNLTHRWPKAAVCGEGEDWHLTTSVDIDFAPGVTQELLDRITCNTGGAILDFWTWVLQPETAGSSSDGGATTA